jgi:hypothetical protein
MTVERHFMAAPAAQRKAAVQRVLLVDGAKPKRHRLAHAIAARCERNSRGDRDVAHRLADQYTGNNYQLAASVHLRLIENHFNAVFRSLFG